MDFFYVEGDLDLMDVTVALCEQVITLVVEPRGVQHEQHLE